MEYMTIHFIDIFESNGKIKEENIIKKGDILIRLREPNIAIYIDKDYEDMMYRLWQ